MKGAIFTPQFAGEPALLWDFSVGETRDSNGGKVINFRLVYRECLGKPLLPGFIRSPLQRFSVLALDALAVNPRGRTQRPVPSTSITDVMSGGGGSHRFVQGLF